MTTLTYGTVCSGIECVSAAAWGLPLVPVFFSEIEPYPCAVLKYRYPQVPNLGDMTKITCNEGIITNGKSNVALPNGRLGMLIGGTPCQDFSQAGLRRGAGGDEGDLGSGTRSSLCYHFCRILKEVQPEWFVFENVYGMLTSNEGRDFAHFIVALGESGYKDIAWRVLDAQYVRVDGMEFAVPQRRRRVFVVGHLGESVESSAAVLLEPYRLRGDNPPKRKARKANTRTAEDWLGVYG